MTGNNQKGLTLIELLIAAAVFSIVFSVAMGTFVSAVKIQRYNLSHELMMDQVSYATEYIARALRMAQIGETGLCMPNGFTYFIHWYGDWVRFMNDEKDCIDFKRESNGVIMVCNTNLFGPGCVPLTSLDYYVTNFRFYGMGEALGEDDQQPRITFILEIEDRNLPDGPEIKIQTTVSQRNLKQ